MAVDRKSSFQANFGLQICTNVSSLTVHCILHVLSPLTIFIAL